MKGCQSGSKSFKVHLDGYNLMPFFKGEVKESPRKEFLYWSDDGDLVRHPGRAVEDLLQGAGAHGPRRLEARDSPTSGCRISTTCVPIRSSGDTESLEYDRWMTGIRAFLIVPAQAIVGQWLESFKEFPIRQKPASFNLDEVMRKLSGPSTGS